MRTQTFFNYFIAIVMVICFSSCWDKDLDRDGVLDENDKCPNVAAKTKDGCPIKREIDKVHFYLETSASMGGYFNRDADYKTIISDLTTKIDKNIRPIDIWFIADTLIHYQGSTDAFSSDIATTRIANRKSSELHDIFNKIAAKTDSNDVSLFVSDCILSFPDEAIKVNPEINRTEAPNALKNHIFSTFTELRQRGLAVSVYAFTSKFYGKYYDYQNVKRTLNGQYRPFYVWVIASRELLKRFDDRLADINSFKPLKSLHFGINNQSVNEAGLLTQVEKNGSWVPGEGKGTLEDVEMPKNDSLRFCLALNLDSLPAYVRTGNYLQQRLQIASEGCSASFRLREKSAINGAALTGPTQPLLFEQSSHFLIVSVSRMDLKDAAIHFTLPIASDTWFNDWSTDNDKETPVTQTKTFAFRHLIDGVIDAYSTKEKNYIDFFIHLSK